MKKKFIPKKIGIIGMGWVGGSYAKDFIARGFDPICYSLEKQYASNKEKIKGCDFVLIAVPSPTTPDGFDDSIVREAVKLVGKGKTAVIKSTVTPGVTNLIQKENPEIYVIHSPEFLSEASADYDASHPKRNIIGIPHDNAEYQRRAEDLLSILPVAPYNTICSSVEAEFIKYARNCMGYVRVVFYNLFYDAAIKEGADWEKIREAIAMDPDNGSTYTQPVHKGGRGASGSCFIKDYAAFVQYYKNFMKDDLGFEVFRTIEKKNIELLMKSKKDIELLKRIYGNGIV